MKTKLKSVSILACCFATTILFSQGIPGDPRFKKAGLIHCIVTSFKGVPKKGETLIFEGIKTKKEVEAITDSKGLCDVWLPKGDTYMIKVLAVGKEQEYSTIEVPNKEGEFKGNYTIKFELPVSATLDDVLFETGKSTLKPSSFASLDKLAELIKRKEDLKIIVIGHTDNQGDAASNMKLSLARANAVKDYLGKKSGCPERLKAEGRGADEPVADNGYEEGRRLNRRTEIQVTE
jgi:outer membrane protein OmpA-like peptidoglycan-associated protein